MDLQLEGRVALITGAGRGIGLAVAETLLAEGARVLLTSRGEKALEKAAKRLGEQYGERVQAQRTDITDKADLEAAVATAVASWGGLDILVNNAGGPAPGDFDQIDDDGWQDAFELAFLSVVRAVRIALPELRKSGAGRVINILSTSVIQPLDGMILSNSLRSGVAGLARTLTRDLGASGVTVNNVCPGHILTGRLRQVAAWRSRNGRQVDPRAAVEAIPAGRLGNPREVAAVVAFFASPQASYISGATLPVDGGACAAS